MNMVKTVEEISQRFLAPKSDSLGYLLVAFLFAALVLTYFRIPRRRKWTLWVLWIWFWVPSLLLLVAIVCHCSALADPSRGYVTEFGTFWSDCVLKFSLFFALFIALLRALADIGISNIQEGKGWFSKAVEKALPELWLVWLFGSIFLERTVDDQLSPWIKAGVNTPQMPIIMNLAFGVTIIVTLVVVIRRRFVRQECFESGLWRFVFSWAAVPMQMMLIGPKRSGKSRLFNLCMSAKVSTADQTGTSAIRRGSFRPHKLTGSVSTMVVSVLDMVGENLGTHLHYARSLRTDEVVFVLPYRCINQEALENDADLPLFVRGNVNGDLDEKARYYCEKYFGALEYATSGLEKGVFKIKAFTLFVNLEYPGDGSKETQVKVKDTNQVERTERERIFKKIFVKLCEQFKLSDDTKLSVVYGAPQNPSDVSAEQHTFANTMSSSYKPRPVKTEEVLHKIFPFLAFNDAPNSVIPNAANVGNTGT
jgi:hypothetical protein